MFTILPYSSRTSVVKHAIELTTSFPVIRIIHNQSQKHRQKKLINKNKITRNFTTDRRCLSSALVNTQSPVDDHKFWNSRCARSVCLSITCQQLQQIRDNDKTWVQINLYYLCTKSERDPATRRHQGVKWWSIAGVVTTSIRSVRKPADERVVHTPSTIGGNGSSVWLRNRLFISGKKTTIGITYFSKPLRSLSDPQSMSVDR